MNKNKIHKYEGIKNNSSTYKEAKGTKYFAIGCMYVKLVMITELLDY